MRRTAKSLIAAQILLCALGSLFRCQAQTPLESQENQAPQPTPASPTSPFAAVPDHSPIYQDIDLLRRDGFAGAREATVSLRVIDQRGSTPANLRGQDFALFVNGTPRTARLHPPDSKTSTISPLVLLVFPPNQPILHSIGVTRAKQYFRQQPAEILTWRVGIYDANGKLFPFTNGRSQLLANLDEVEHAPSPFVYMWDTSWLTKAQELIATMQSYEGPKVILEMNPLAEAAYGSTDQFLAHDGPAELMPAAQHIAAHIYVANVGGPEVLVPGGDAAAHQPAQVNTWSGLRLGSVPAANMQVDPRQIAALNNFAFNTSQMMQAAAGTYGGFSNSLDTLAAQIHHDLDGNYSIDFDLTPEDRDRGIPNVEVRLLRRDLKVAILDVVPVGFVVDNDREIVSRNLMDAMRKAAEKPVSSPDFQIAQHVDYFPLRAGLEPLLPMTGIVEWTGQGQGPHQLSVAESVEDLTLSTVVLEREIHATWDGHSLSWERDGRLRPGDYVWRVLVHDGNGKVYASAQENVKVSFPHESPVAVSSLILGSGCREDSPSSSGLQHRTHESPGKSVTPNSVALQAIHPQIDPLRALDCRLKPESNDRFASTGTLHAFVRIYPSERFNKHKADSWTATFTVRSASGAIESEKELPFTIDSGSGYLAFVQMPLNTPEIRPGPHTVDVEMHGPGIRSELKQSRSISIQ